VPLVTILLISILKEKHNDLGTIISGKKVPVSTPRVDTGLNLRQLVHITRCGIVFKEGRMKLNNKAIYQ
jgi:hypothetical protein